MKINLTKVGLTSAIITTAIMSAQFVTIAETKGNSAPLTQTEAKDIRANITRKDFSIMLSKTFYQNSLKVSKLPFEDISQLTQEEIDYLVPLYSSGILNGVDEDGKIYMRPDSLLTREEAATLIGRVINSKSITPLSFSDANDISEFAFPYVSRLFEIGIISGKGDGTFAPKSNLTIADANTLIKKIDNYRQKSFSQVSTLSGSGLNGIENSVNETSSFSLPQGITADKNGNLVIFDTNNAAVRGVSSDKTSTILGGTNLKDEYGFAQGFYLDAEIKDALFARPTKGVFNSKGEFFITDSANHAIRFINAGRVFTFSGSDMGYLDGSNKVAKFNLPTSIAVDKNDNLYVTDTGNNCIRRIDINGNVTTIAGVAGKSGYADGISATSLFNEPSGIVVSDDGTIYVSDTGNHLIRQISDGKVSTFSGKYIASEVVEEYPTGGNVDGKSKDAQFNFPRGLTFAGKQLIVADSGNHLIRSIAQDGTVTTLAGNSEAGDVDGYLLDCQFNKPSDVYYLNGKLYIADMLNNKIKVFNLKG